MKYLLVTGIFPPEIGGPATVIAQLADDLRMRGHAVHVVAYGDQASTSDVTRVSRRGCAARRYVRLARAVAKHLDPETVVLATDVFSVGIPVRIALTGRKNTFVVRLGGEWCWEDAITKGRTHATMRSFWRTEFSGWRKAISLMNYRWIAARAKKICVTSEMLLDVLRPALKVPDERFVTVANVATGPCHAPRVEGTPHAPLRLLYVGRFAPVKNVPFFGNVLKELARQNVAVAMTFAGDGPDLEIVKKMLNGMPDVTFAGRVSAQAVRELYSETDVVVLPSLTDICPNSVVEALACGVPAIITSEHGLSAGYAGFMTCSPSQIDEWVQAIASLQDRATYQSLCRAIALPTQSGVSLREQLERV